MSSSSLIFFLSPRIEKCWPCYYYRVEKKENKSHRCFISPVSDVIFWGKKSFGAISRESDVSRWRKNHKNWLKRLTSSWQTMSHTVHEFRRWRLSKKRFETLRRQFSLDFSANDADLNMYAIYYISWHLQSDPLFLYFRRPFFPPLFFFWSTNSFNIWFCFEAVFRLHDTEILFSTSQGPIDIFFTDSSSFSFSLFQQSFKGTMEKWCRIIDFSGNVFYFLFFLFLLFVCVCVCVT